jgi:hypothetical protein
LGFRLLNCCHICSGTDSLHGHHVIPRAYGGDNSPIVTLCAVCHNLVHKYALIKDLTDYELPGKMRYLVLKIKQAKALTQEDKNKKLNFHANFEPEYAIMIRQLCDKYGKSQQDIIRLAVLNLFNK